MTTAVKTFSGNDRAWIRRALAVHELDVLVVGGGINGCGVARDLALRGARVGLVEKEDFASGTSSRSSRLIHGGLRYLEEAYKLLPRPSAIRQIGLVFESVTERWRMSRLARHLARPLPFVFPGIAGGRVKLGEVKAGVMVYDALALGRNLPHRSLDRNGVLAELPAFDPSKLTGGVLYYDFRTNDARMTLENAISAHEAGALVLSRARVVAPIVERERGRRRLAGAVLHDEIGGETFQVRAKVVVSCTGPWTDDVLRALELEKPGDHPQVRPTKGIHVVVPREKLPLRSAAALTHPKDGRVLFALPYEERSVLGTTDTDWRGSADDVRVEAADVDYLLDVAKTYFPSSKLTRADVISSWAGLRPLVNEEAVTESSVPREHRILRTAEGLVAIFGGKLTTYRLMCAELADVVGEELAARGGPSLGGSRTEQLPLPGAEGLDTDADLTRVADEAMLSGGLDPASARHLAETYGARTPRLLARIARDPGGRIGRRIEPDLPFLWVEVVWAAEQEMALSLADVFIRRTGVFYRALDQGLSAAPKAAALLGAALGWDDARVAQEVDRYREIVTAGRAWREGASASAPTSIATAPSPGASPARTDSDPRPDPAP